MLQALPWKCLCLASGADCRVIETFPAISLIPVSTFWCKAELVNIPFSYSGGFCYRVRASNALKILDLSCNHLEDVGAQSSFCLGFGPDCCLVVCVNSDASPLSILICVFSSDLQCQVDVLQLCCVYCRRCVWSYVHGSYLSRERIHCRGA